MNSYMEFYPDEYLITILSGRTLSGWNFIRIYPDEVYPDEILSTRMKFYPDENLSGFIRPFLTSRMKIS